jgi:hypothetical protein
MRSLKIGFVLTAMSMLGATVASSAFAVTGSVTSTSGVTHVLGHGEDTGENDTITLFGGEIFCHQVNYTVEKTGTTAGAFLELPAESVSVTPAFTGCTTGGSLTTVTTNGCTTDFTLTTGQVALTCPTGKVVETHRYNSEPHSAGVCTNTIKPTTEASVSHSYGTVHTTARYGTVTFTNLANGTIGVHGTIEGITSQTHGSCSFGFTLNTSEAIYHMSVTLVARDTNEETVPVHIG